MSGGGLDWGSVPGRAGGADCSAGAGRMDSLIWMPLLSALITWRAVGGTALTLAGVAGLFLAA